MYVQDPVKPISICRTSLFQIFWVVCVIFICIQILIGHYVGKQLRSLQIRRYVLRRLICVCAVYLCPTKRTLGLYGLIVVSKNVVC